MRKKNLDLRGKLLKKDQEFDKTDIFLGKDILTMANKMNSSRNIMFNSHLEQATVLEKPEFPRVFTNYENQVGKYSSSYYRNKNKKIIIAKIPKFKNKPNTNYLLVVKDVDSDYYDIIERKIGENLTESYCYLYDNHIIDSKKVNNVINKDEVIYHSTSFDNDMNYRYGINVKCLYLIENNTIEDAIVCSESFAKKMKSHYIEEIEVNINNNDILCNLYSNEDEEYKTFPNIGESTNGEVLLARRRINYEHALFDLQDENLRNINYNIDTVFYSNGELFDIDIYCNKDIKDIEKNFYNKQIVKYLKMQEIYYNKIFSVLDKIISDKNNKYSFELSFLYRKAKDILDPNIKWKNEKSDFDNLLIRFKVLKESYLHIGSKIAGRYGNKGVISKIVPDEEMPITEYGERVEVVLNALGVVNRLNPAQIYEVELNFISNNIVRKMKTLDNLKEKEKLFFAYINDINPNQAESLKEYYKNLNINKKKKFMSDIESNGIYLHQPPFWDNICFDRLTEIYDKYDWIEPYTCYIKGKEIKNKLVVGEQYIIKMKHEPKSKFSTRSTAYINMKNAPSKSLNYKKHQVLYSTTAIRLGEMEFDNLLLNQKPEEVVRMSSMYSASEKNRLKTHEALLLEDILNLKEIKLENEFDNYNVEILNAYLKSLGLKLGVVEE